MGAGVVGWEGGRRSVEVRDKEDTSHKGTNHTEATTRKERLRFKLVYQFGNAAADLQSEELGNWEPSR